MWREYRRGESEDNPLFAYDFLARQVPRVTPGVRLPVLEPAAEFILGLLRVAAVWRSANGPNVVLYSSPLLGFLTRCSIT